MSQEAEIGAQLAGQLDAAIPVARDVDLNVSGEEAFLRRGRYCSDPQHVPVALWSCDDRFQHASTSCTRAECECSYFG